MAHRYRIEREVGRGGMATVFLALDLRHGRKVAIKVLRPELAAVVGAERFLREIRVTAGLHHPHVLALYDSGEATVAEGSPRAASYLFYVMPYVEGESLRDRMNREKQLPVAEALRIASEVAGALSYAHGKGIIHRDVKPENILLETGHAMVADFGIARAIGEGGERLTGTGLAVGTPTYASPEQALGSEDVDARTDVYSLACVLYEMLAGQPPFTAATVEGLVRQHVMSDVRPVTDLRPSVLPHIGAVIARALAKAPADRFDSMSRFGEALTAGRVLDPAAAPAGERSIAVLPFTNMSADPDTEYFSDGITEEIINALAQLSGLRVAARTSSFAFKGKAADVTEIGGKLHVGSVLEGSVRRAGNRLRVTVQLIDVTNGFHIWSERFDRDLADVFAIQDEIARAVADRLTIAWSKEASHPIVRSGTRNPEAYDLYLRGRFHWARRGLALHKAVEYFDRAIAADPTFAAPYAGLAMSYAILGGHGHIPVGEGLAKARSAANRALALDDRAAEGYEALGLVEMDSPGAAERALRRAIELNPSNGYPVYVLAQVLAGIGRTDEAMAAARQARHIEPLSPLINSGAAFVLARLGASDEAWIAAQTAIELDPTFPLPYWLVAWLHQHEGRAAAAIEAAEQAVTLSGRSSLMLSLLGRVYARIGQREKALELLAELESRNTSAVFSGVVYWELGERDRAFALFERAAAERNLWVVSHGPGFDELARDPRWVALLERSGPANPRAAW